MKPGTRTGMENGSGRVAVCHLDRHWDSAIKAHDGQRSVGWDSRRVLRAHVLIHTFKGWSLSLLTKDDIESQPVFEIAARATGRTGPRRRRTVDLSLLMS